MIVPAAVCGAGTTNFELEMRVFQPARSCERLSMQDHKRYSRNTKDWGKEMRWRHIKT